MDDKMSLGASQSLEALVCYPLMYKNWWSCSLGFNDHRTQVENGDSEPRDTKGSPDEDVWNVLLSEPHAALQATQRALEAIQSRVTMMIQHHGHLQVESSELMEEQHASEGRGAPETR